MSNEINWVEVKERKRVYKFLTHQLAFENVKRIEIRASGKHRIETEEGIKAFVNTGWEYILIDADNWNA